mgnify:FL=1
MIIDGRVVEPLTEDRFEDVTTVLGKGGIGGCWCMYWSRPSSKAWAEGARGGSKARNRETFLERVRQGPPPGLILYVDEHPAAWCRVMARSELPGLAASRYFKTDLDIDGVWSLPCFVVRREYRGRGLTEILIRAAVELARSQGAGIVEAYPWDTSERKADSVVYTGLASTFDRLGFDVVQRLAPHKPMMRLKL